MFELVGRLAMYGIWVKLLSNFSKDRNAEFSKSLLEISHHSITTLLEIINNNPILASPLKDDQMIEIALIMFLAQETNSAHRFAGWLRNLSERTTMALITNGPYPTHMQDHIDLLSHPVDASEAYRKEACAGSILYPFLFLWLHRVDSEENINEFVSKLSVSIPNCTHQAWLPDELTDEQIWSGNTHNGISILDLNPELGQEKIIETLNKALKECDMIHKMGAIKKSLHPLLLAACRHYRMPIPPTFWFIKN